MPEPLAQERAHRVLDEAHEVVELDHARRLGGGSGAGRNGAAGGALARQRAGAVERDAVEAPRPAGHELAGDEVARVERLQRVADDDRSRAAPSARTVRSTTSSSSPTGTAGGRAAFVRSSLPV